MTLPRRTKIALAAASAILAIPVICVVVLATTDWNRIKPWLNARTSEAIGRPFTIHGDLSLTWQRQAATPGHSGSWLPWPHLIAKDVHVGNPLPADRRATAEAVAAASTSAASTSAARSPAAASMAASATAPGASGAKTARAGQPAARALPPESAELTELASVDEFSFSLNPLALLTRTIAIPELRFTAPVVFLQRGADGKNNWTFAHDDQPSPWTLDLQSIVFTKGNVHLVDAVERADIRAAVDTIAGDPRYGVSWKLKGKLNTDAVSGSGKAGAVLSLQRQSEPYPLAAAIKVGSTAIAIEGTLTKPAELAALDLRLKVSGASMARLYGLTGLVLPETPPFATEGHLTGSLDKHSSHWIYSDFTGKVGNSDITGKLEYQSRLPRALLSGVVSSRLLTFKDLGPLIGADSNASKAARGAEQMQPSNRVLPVETFKTERWTSIDADVSYAAAQIVRDNDLPISNLNTHIILKDGVLSLLPLNFDIAGGTLASNIKLDGSGKINRNAIRAELKTSARHLQLKQLFPTIDKLQASAGEINGDASLSATGNSVASLLGSSNGEVKTLINEGTISKLLLEEMGLNVGNVVLSKMFGDKQVKLHCMASDFAVTNGLMQTRKFVVDTEEAVLNISGDVNLANEQLDLTLKPDTKGFRVFSLRSPLYVTGTFSNPDVSVDKKVLGLRAGGAIALAVVTPFAALLPLINTSTQHDSACAALLAQARLAPVAPAPGQTSRAKK